MVLKPRDSPHGIIGKTFTPVSKMCRSIQTMLISAFFSKMYRSLLVPISFRMFILQMLLAVAILIVDYMSPKWRFPAFGFSFAGKYLAARFLAFQGIKLQKKKSLVGDVGNLWRHMLDRLIMFPHVHVLLFWLTVQTTDKPSFC